MSDKLRVSVTLTVDVSREDWAMAYGVENTAKAIREDVKSYIGNGLKGADDAGITVVDWK